MTRSRFAASFGAAWLLTACGSNSSSPSASHLTPDATTAATSEPEAPTEVAAPGEFYFIVDGPLVTNGPPWNCVTAGTQCEVPEGGFSGTIDLVDDCIVVHGTDSAPGSLAVVVFGYGATWDAANSQILGLWPGPIAIGDEAPFLADFWAVPDEWTLEHGLPDVPDKVRECMRATGTDVVGFNAPWIQIGEVPLPTQPNDTRPTTGP